MGIKSTVEIANEHGESFKVELVTYFLGDSEGEWRTLDKGSINYNNGTTRYQKSHGTLSTRHLLFYAFNIRGFGIRLNDFDDAWSVNKQGSGILVEVWALGIKPGRISWARLSS